MEVRQRKRSRFNFIFSSNKTGQWDMIVNLVNKYGIVPKNAFPESTSSEAALQMNKLLRTKVIQPSWSNEDFFFLRFSYVHLLKKLSKQLIKEITTNKILSFERKKWWKKFDFDRFLFLENPSRCYYLDSSNSNDMSGLATWTIYIWILRYFEAI